MKGSLLKAVGTAMVTGITIKFFVNFNFFVVVLILGWGTWWVTELTTWWTRPGTRWTTTGRSW